MLKQFNLISALKAGILATVIMTVVMYGLPLVGIPPMNIMAALGSVFPFKISPYILGAPFHFGIGIVLALIYAVFFYSCLPGPGWSKGMLYSLLPWLFAITLLGPSLQLASKISRGTPSSTVANPCAPKAAQPCGPKTAQPCTPPATQPCAPKAVNPCAPGAASKGGVPPQLLSLVVHLIYGVVLGTVYRPRL